MVLEELELDLELEPDLELDLELEPDLELDLELEVLETGSLLDSSASTMLDPRGVLAGE